MMIENEDIIISVVIAAYNAEKYINKCIDSLLIQSMKKIEVICVDDSSTDNTLQILNEYSRIDHRVKTYSIEENSIGAGKARNFGLNIAQGKYVIVLDADDFFDENMLEKLYKYAETNDADVVVFDAVGWDTINERYNYGFSVIYDRTFIGKTVVPGDFYEDIFSITSTVAWNKIYLNSFISKSGLKFQENNKIDDLYFAMCSLAVAGKIYFTDEKLLYYRYNNADSQMSGITSYPYSSYLACREVKWFLQKLNIYDKYKKSFIKFALWECLIELDRMKTSKTSFEKLFNALKDLFFYELDINDYTIEKISSIEEWQRKRYKEIMEYDCSEYVFRHAFGVNKTSIEVRYVFPKDEIPHDSRIVLYGAGRIGRMYYIQNLLDEYCIIARWIDMEYLKYQEKGLPVLGIDSLFMDDKVDYYLIALKNRSVAESVIKQLVEYGIDKCRIVWNIKGE